MPCSAISAVKNFNLLIEHQCPQCGAPAVLSETDRLFTCDFCRVRSYLYSRGVFRYLLPDKAPEGKTLYYIPYWRFKGMLFSCVPDGVRQKYIDVSYQALVSSHLPISLGFRSQTLKLRFISPESAGRFLPINRSLDQMMQIQEQNYSQPLPKPIYHQAHIGEHSSLIYAPFYVEDCLYDAVLNEPVGTRITDDVSQMLKTADKPRWGLNFLPTLCPDCGWDLEGPRDTLVLLCRNCNSAWKAGNSHLKRLKFGHLTLNVDTDFPVLYLPFWRIKADIMGLVLDTYADLAKVANLPVVARPEWRDIPYRFFTPAFKIRPQTFLPLATKMTLSLPQETTVEHLPDGVMHPVTLNVEEAVESLKVILADFIKPRNVFYPDLANIKLTPQSYFLVYVPFICGHHDLTQPEYKVSILKNQLSLAKHL